jgi:NTP pyrophosphatase (non-canonical NTP hydrolase)
MPALDSLETLKAMVRRFCEERDWDQFHNIKDLSMALSIEAAELMELFRWKDAAQLEALLQNATKKEEVEDELSDILFFILRIAQTSDIDLAKSLERKIAKNALKYPVEKAKGSNKKYNEL